MTTRHSYDDTDALREAMFGRSVVSVQIDDDDYSPEGRVLLDDGTELILHGNDGGCSCGGGDYALTRLNDMPINGITNVEIDVDEHDGYSLTYRIFVLARQRTARWQGPQPRLASPASWRTTAATPPPWRPTVGESPETPTPSLADRLDRFRLAVMADGERSLIMNPPVSDEDRTAAAAQLRQLDRIEAALGDVPDWIDALEANIGNHCTVMSVSAQADLVTLFRRLADALEVPDADT